MGLARVHRIDEIEHYTTMYVWQNKIMNATNTNNHYTKGWTKKKNICLPNMIIVQQKRNKKWELLKVDIKYEKEEDTQ